MHLKADFPGIVVSDRQFIDSPLLVIADSRHGEPIIALAILDVAIAGLDPNKRGCIKLSANR